MNFPKLFSPNYQILLVDCELKDDLVLAKIAQFEANLNPGSYILRENAVTPVCKILLPDWAIADETLIFLEQIELEIFHAHF